MTEGATSSRPPHNVARMHGMRAIEVAAVGVIALVTAAAAVLHPLVGGACAVAVRLYDNRREGKTLRRIAALEPDRLAELQRIGKTWG